MNADPSRQLSAPPTAGQPVSRLDRVTLQLGVVVAVIIACCSYAVSATSLYALGVQAGYSWWQAAAVPVVADGPAIYGMFRIISRSRRGARGAGYGWLLVIAGTAASIGGNVAHAQPDLVAQGIAAAIPLAVLAMLEGLKGDASEVTRLAAQPAATDRPSLDGNRLADTTTVHRAETRPTDADTEVAGVRELPARPAATAEGMASARTRLEAAYRRERPGGPLLAEAAGCGRSSAAAFLQRQRPPVGERPR